MIVNVANFSLFLMMKILHLNYHALNEPIYLLPYRLCISLLMLIKDHKNVINLRKSLHIIRRVKEHAHQGKLIFLPLRNIYPPYHINNFMPWKCLSQFFKVMNIVYRTMLLQCEHTGMINVDRLDSYIKCLWKSFFLIFFALPLLRLHIHNSIFIIHEPDFYVFSHNSSRAHSFCRMKSE